MACKPGSVLAFRERWPFLWAIRCRMPRATYPDGGRKPPLPSLFGLAPGGACRAVFVAEDAVRSYRTISTLPGQCPLAVCFLLRFPWSRLRRTLSGTVFPWSPDFPLPFAQGSGQRPSGHLTYSKIWRLDRNVNLAQQCRENRIAFAIGAAVDP